MQRSIIPATPLRALASVVIAGCMAACHGTPQLDHHEISVRLKAGLRSQTRLPNEQERKGDSLYFATMADKIGPVALPIFWDAGIPYVHGRINHRREVPFVIDTGAEECALEARTAVANHVDMLDLPSANMTANGVTGSEPVMLGVASHFSLGSWNLEQLPFFVRTHETTVRVGLKREVIGADIVGMNIIARACDYLTYDFPAERVILGMGGPFKRPSGKGVWSTPFVLEKGRPFVQLRSGGLQWKALVDTGYFGEFDIKKSTAERLRLMDSLKPAQVFAFGLGDPIAGESPHFDVVTVPRLDGLGPRLTNVSACLVPERSDSIIGCTLLRPYRVTFDFRRKLLWLEAPGK